jgi:hypothetical protein
MKRLILIAWISFAGIGLLTAQSPGDPSEGVRIEWDTANSRWRVKWWGKAGRTYFIQHSVDLVRAWEWLPVVEAGNDAVKEGGLTVDGGDRSFWRLRYSDIPTSDPKGADFDGDGLSNLAEVQAGADPFDTDSDNDGLPDGWEVAHGLNPMDDADAGSDFDDDGLTNLQEFNAGTDPRKFSSGINGAADGWWLQHELDPYSASSQDTDADGRSDETEFLHGTDPNASDQAPDYPFPSDAPQNFVVVENSDGSRDLTWEDSATNRKRFVIRRIKDDGTREVIAIIGPNLRSYHLAAPL